MKNKNLPFVLGAIAGAAGLTAMAYLATVKDETDISDNNKKIKYLIKELNLLFFTASGVSIKIQSLQTKIAARELGELKESFSQMYEHDKDVVENYFYYLDHVEQFEDLHKEIIECYSKKTKYLVEANLILKKYDLKPVSFRGMRPEMLVTDDSYKNSDTSSVVMMCDCTLDFCEKIMSKVDLLIDGLERIQSGSFHNNSEK